MSNRRNNILLIIALVFIVPVVLFMVGDVFKGNETNAMQAHLYTEDTLAFQEVQAPPIPEEISFAGENVPLRNFDVYESLDREIIVNSFFHSQTIRFIKMAPRYFEMIEPILKEYEVPEDFKYLALAESGFDPKIVSPAGAVGFWQFMKGTARDYGLEVSGEIDERYHIKKSTVAACKYLHESYEKYGNWTTVAASYNAGRRGIDRQIDRQDQEHYYNLLVSEETSRYVFRIIALKVILENPSKYGFNIAKSEIYPSIPTKTIKVNGKVEDFAAFAEKHRTNYKILKYFNPWLREAYLTNRSGKTYEIEIPKGKY